MSIIAVFQAHLWKRGPPPVEGTLSLTLLYLFPHGWGIQARGADSIFQSSLLLC